jgi:hypothetical protein|nr:hypothetical protein [Kofleriaceae bacterium]
MPTRSLCHARFEFRSRDDIAPIAGCVAAMAPYSRLLEVVLAELMLNAIEHGNLEIGGELKADLMRRGELSDEIARRSSDARYANRVAWLEVTAIRGDRLRLEVGDQGGGFAWRTVDVAAPTPSGGRGLALASALAPRGLMFNAAGNVVALEVLA